MTPARIIFRAATADDDSFVVEMARHACVIEDRPLPDSDDDEVLEMLPPAGVVPIIAEDHSGTPLGAMWTYYGSPPLRCDAAGVPLPELCIGVAPRRRGAGVGGPGGMRHPSPGQPTSLHQLTGVGCDGRDAGSNDLERAHGEAPRRRRAMRARTIDARRR